MIRCCLKWFEDIRNDEHLEMSGVAFFGFFMMRFDIEVFIKTLAAARDKY